jgi:hypothetical protein
MRARALVLLVVALASGVAAADPPAAASGKGWALHSWQDNGWSFALVAGTNRLRRWDEIAAARVRGLADLKKKLGALGKGETVVWSFGEALAKPVPVTLALPPDSIVQDAATECDRLGVTLAVPSPVTGAVASVEPSRESLAYAVVWLRFNNPSDKACRILHYALVWPAGRKIIGQKTIAVASGALLNRRLKVVPADGDLAKLDPKAARLDLIAACK